MDRLPYGAGTTEQRGGLWFAKLPPSKGRERLGPYPTRGEAIAELLVRMEEELAIPSAPPGSDLATYGRAWLTAKQKGGDYRAIKRELNRWACYVEGTRLGSMPITEIEDVDVRTWLKELRGKRVAKLSPKARTNVLNLVKGALGHAVDERDLRINPATTVNVPKAASRTAGERNQWTWLRVEEAEAVLEAKCLTDQERSTLALAIFTGLRAGELWALKWDAVEFDRRVIRVELAVGEDNRLHPPKSGDRREVPMLPLVHALLLRQREVTGDEPFVFWSRKLCHYTTGHNAGLRKAVAEVGIERRVRFHDLRHTFASLALHGDIPDLPALRLEDLRQWLGHSDQQTTQRYAHLAKDGLRRLVHGDEAPSGQGFRKLSQKLSPKASKVAVRRQKYGDPNGNRTPRGDARNPEREAVSGTVWDNVASLADEGLEAIETGGPEAEARVREVLGRICMGALAAETLAAFEGPLAWRKATEGLVRIQARAEAMGASGELEKTGS